MKRYFAKTWCLLAAVVFVFSLISEQNAFARAGGGRSFGSRGSRSFSPSRSYSRPSPSRDQSASSPYQPGPYQPQQQRGGFLRGLAGGIVGGMLGGMLFRSLGFGGWGGAGGGIGLFEIILIGGIIYLIYRFIRRRREEAPSYRNTYSPSGYQPEMTAPIPTGTEQFAQGTDDVAAGLSYIRQMDPSFAEDRFNDTVMDIFFKIQGAWMNRDLATVNNLLTDEMRRLLQQDIDAMLRDRRINRLENIAVRNVEIVEAWQESGQDFLTARIYANLLDYTTDDTTGAVVSGSKMDPVKFEEFWTFTRPVGNNPWRLSAISQA